MPSLRLSGRVTANLIIFEVCGNAVSNAGQVGLVDNTYLNIIQLERIALAGLDHADFHGESNTSLHRLYDGKIEVLKRDVVFPLEVVEDRYTGTYLASCAFLQVEFPFLGIFV